MLLSVVADLVGNDAVAQVSSVLQSLLGVTDRKWQDQEDVSYYSDEECEDEVDVTVASIGLCECGSMQIRNAMQES